jgi:pimeloyl-ACP methyl ester carboxylesterase
MNRKNVLGINLLLFFVVSISNAQTLTHDESLEYTKKKVAERNHTYNAKYGDEWDARELTNGSHKMKFSYTIFGDMPAGGCSLYISMHGGGNTTEEANTKQWNNQKKLYAPAEGVYLTPKSPTNSWNMWHQDYMDGFIEKLITLAVIKENVNLNKIYIMGYSAGGDGTYQLAPRLAELWAGAAMSAGHPGDAQIENLRNLPFALYMGGKDEPYNRNGLAREWGDKFKELHQSDPEGYAHEVKIFETCGHWMEHNDSISFAWMSNYTRNPIPNKVLWTQDDVERDHFYWIEDAEQGKSTGLKIVASYNRDKNSVSIDETTHKSVIISLNDEMLKLDKRVKIYLFGKKIFSGKVPRTKQNIDQAIDNMRDEHLIFPSRILVNIEDGSATVIK